MIYNKKIKIVFNKSDIDILDNQSRILNWLYNKLLNDCIDDYQNNNNKKKLLTGYNLRNYMVTLKGEYPFLKKVYGHVLQEAPNRLKKAYEKSFNEKAGFPHFRSFSKKWFSLVYDEPKGWSINNNVLKFSLGILENNYASQQMAKKPKNTHIKGILCENVFLKEGEKFKQLHILKRKNTFYAMFTIETPPTKEDLLYKDLLNSYKEELSKYKILKANYKNKSIEAFNDGDFETSKNLLSKSKKLIKPEKPSIPKPDIPNNIKWISLDPNHKNFFVGIDYLGKTFEFENLKLIKYWDKVINTLKSKRDKCIKKYKKKTTKNNNSYWIHSPRWNKLNKALDNAYQKRNEQLKKALFVIASFLYKNYDLVIIGDYTPSKETAKFNNMHRSMLNQTVIGKLRKTLEWVALKSGKYYLCIDETDTTKTCCICGNKEHKDPSIREFTCQKCNTFIKRDINSAINIAKKANKLYTPSLENINKINNYKKVTYKTDKI